MRSWFEIKDAKTSAEIYLYDEIGLFGVTASDFAKEIRNLKGKTLNVFINSPGGNAFDGVAIYNSLARHDGTVNVTVDGVAASIASVIAQAGTTRTMAKGSAMMVHEAWGIAAGPAGDMQAMIDQLGVVNENIAGIYVGRAGGTSEEWRARMAEETWYSADGAVEANLADGMVEETRIAASNRRVFNLSKFNNVPDWVQQDENSDPVVPGVEPEPSPPKEDDMDDTAIRQALGLDGEGDIVTAISALKAQAQDIATGEKGAENKLQRELSDARQKLLSQESEYGQRILALEDRNRQKEAEWTVDTAIQQGRVAPKDRDLALKLALSDADGFAKFAANLRVDLNERGMAMDAAMAAIEPTADEVRIGATMGVTREQLIAQKAKDAGVALPS
jgi:ATP-dependent protease ClpP protease subunit